MPSLTMATARLMLRPIGPEDAPAMAAILGDLAVSRWLTRVPHPYGPDDARAFIGHVTGERERRRQLALALIHEGAYAGSVGVDGLDGALPEIGWYLAPALWGRGLMTEAVGAVLAHLDRRGVTVLASGAFVDNAASLAIQRRFGFQPVSRESKNVLALGQMRPHVTTRRVADPASRLAVAA